MKRRAKLVGYFNEQAGHCVYCDTEMTLELHKPNTAEIEHIVPRSKGGKRKAFNEVAACHACNHEKSDTDIGEWLRSITGAKHIPVYTQELIRFEDYS